MRNRILMIAAWTLALCLPTLAWAQQPQLQRGQDTWEFSLSGGVLYLDAAFRGWLAQNGSGLPFANTADPGALAPTAVARVGYNFNRHLGFSLAASGAMGSGVSYLTEEAAVTYTMNLGARTSPFVLAGMDLTRVSGQNSRVSHSSSGVLGGIGIRHMLNENLALRVEGQMRFEQYKEVYFDKLAENSAITIGLSYFVGGRRPREARAVAAACPACTLARVDTVVRMRRDTIIQMRRDTVRRTDTVLVMEPQPDQLVLRVQFATDSTALLRKSRPVLDTIARAILATPNSKWEVQGHTDNVGTAEHNRVLAQGRAQTVVDYLVSRGVDRSILTAKGFGEDRPVFSNSTIYGRAQNRRVQLRRIPAPPTGPPVR